MTLPEDFIRETRLLMGEARFNRFIGAFDEEAPTSIRLNPRFSRNVECGARPKAACYQRDARMWNENTPSAGFSEDTTAADSMEEGNHNSPFSILNSQFDKVPWCPEGFYLSGRPQFTFDPLFHAGCYYVQESASMFITHVLNSLEFRVESVEFATAVLSAVPSMAVANSPLSTLHSPLKALDLCAAPGGKSTAMRTVLPEGSVLVSNEPIPTRAQILLENITKWGWPDCIVTNNYPRDFRKAKMTFDLILCDVPCSGEGMFRKDPATISEWSLQNVEKCWRLQREIVADAWECLNPGGLLIYSTCTYNIKENEENVRWILETYDAEPVAIPTDASWNITGSLLPGFDAPVYRFIPGITRSEGLFLCVLRKSGECRTESLEFATAIDGTAKRTAVANSTLYTLNSQLKQLKADLPQGDFPHVDLSYSDALRYLRGESLVLPPDTPRGIVTVTYRGVPLGPAKNIGNRANNLYPKPWRIKTTHLPTEPVEIIYNL
jgi:16S rRNA C967 or C1407 C5-methylase (RsmB/RsmF family)